MTSTTDYNIIRAKVQQWVKDSPDKTEEELAAFLVELGFDFGDLPASCLPLPEMLQNYVDGKANENQFTEDGYSTYKAFHNKSSRSAEVDVFDFKAYFEEFLLFTRYFSGLELYLRVAIWLSYKYEYTQNKEGKAGMDKLDKQLRGTSNKKKFLETMTDTFEPKVFIEKWYLHFRPSKLDRKDFVDYVMNKPRYVAHPDGIFNQLYHKYVDKEWSLLEVLWFSQRDVSEQPIKEKPKPAKKVASKKPAVAKVDAKVETKKEPAKCSNAKPKVANKKAEKPAKKVVEKEQPIVEEVSQEESPTPTRTLYRETALLKLTVPELKDILRKEGKYGGHSKSPKPKLIAAILAI